MIAAYPLSVSTGDDYAARLGLVLRTARYVREMTREAVAEGCEVSAETVARWERGNVDLRGHALGVLAEVLRLPADLLLDPPSSRSAILVKIAAFDQARDYPAGPRP
jgi:transcriptional regulator with XRE-family HTH domain